MKKRKEKDENENGWDKFLKVTRYKVGPVKLSEGKIKKLSFIIITVIQKCRTCLQYAANRNGIIHFLCFYKNKKTKQTSTLLWGHTTTLKNALAPDTTMKPSSLSLQGSCTYQFVKMHSPMQKSWV